MIKKFFQKYRPPKFLLFFFLLIPLLLCFKNNMRLDNDTWFLIHSGDYVLSSGIPYTEPFTMHQNFDFVMQQWLSASIFALVYHSFGALGLACFVTLLAGVFLFLFYRLCMLLSKRNFYLSFLLTFVVGLLLSLGFFVARPQIFSFIIYVLLFYCLESYIQKKKRRYLLFLPLLSLLEINLHGSLWWMLVCFMIPYLIDSFSFSFFGFHGEGYPKKPLFLAFLSMIFVAFLNPYGLSMLTYLFVAYGCPYMQMIVEMKPPTIKSFFGITVYASILVVLFLYLRDKNKPLKVRYFLLLLGTIYLALTAKRGFPFFLIAAIFPLASYFEKKGRRMNIPFSLRGTVFSCVVLTFLFGSCFFLVSQGIQVVHPLDGAVEYLDTHADEETMTLYTGFDDGSYLEFRGYHPYIDPRAEVFLPGINHQKDVLGEYYHLQYETADPIAIEEFLKEYSFTHLLIQKKDILWDYLAESDSYQLVYQDKKYKIYIPKDEDLI